MNSIEIFAVWKAKFPSLFPKKDDRERPILPKRKIRAILDAAVAAGATRTEAEQALYDWRSAWPYKRMLIIRSKHRRTLRFHEAQCYQALHRDFPKLFDVLAFRPLEIGIREKLFAWCKENGFREHTLTRTLYWYCHQKEYLRMDKSVRYALDGSPVPSGQFRLEWHGWEDGKHVVKQHGIFASMEDAVQAICDWWKKNAFTPPYVRYVRNTLPTCPIVLTIDYGSHVNFYRILKV